MSLIMMKKKPSINGYSKLEKEDPQDIIHRRAQFLIYKALKQADSSRKPSFLRIRFCRLKIKIGNKLKKLKKNMSGFNFIVRVRIYKRIVHQLKLLFCNNGDFSVPTLPSIVS
ncbi:uncharacterized protein [Euphorbia lathyris]|uniref:uncharacterized protein n=1 Tax=Euphorbia lathyris TaxID=212925 RepID=UPI0033138038